MTEARKAAQQREAQRQMEDVESVVMRAGRPTAMTMLAMHDAECGRGMTTVTLAELAAECGVRLGPGPRRPEHHRQ